MSRKTFSKRTGTMFEGLRTLTEVVVIVVTLLCYGTLFKRLSTPSDWMNEW